jgi:hypothetical protein
MPGSRTQFAYLPLTTGDRADFRRLLACSQLVLAKHAQARSLDYSLDIVLGSVVIQTVPCSRMALRYHQRFVFLLKKVPTRTVCAHASLCMYPHFPRLPTLRLQGCEADRSHLHTPRLYAYSPPFSPDWPSSFVGKREAFLDRIHCKLWGD